MVWIKVNCQNYSQIVKNLILIKGISFSLKVILRNTYGLW